MHSQGYAGVDNPVFFNENTDMCLGNVRPQTTPRPLRNADVAFRRPRTLAPTFWRASRRPRSKGSCGPCKYKKEWRTGWQERRPPHGHPKLRAFFSALVLEAHTPCYSPAFRKSRAHLCLYRPLVMGAQATISSIAPGRILLAAWRCALGARLSRSVARHRALRPAMIRVLKNSQTQPVCNEQAP